MKILIISLVIFILIFIFLTIYLIKKSKKTDKESKKTDKEYKKTDKESKNKEKESKGDLKMGRADWSSGYIQAEIVKLILEELGYNVAPLSYNELGPRNAYTATYEEIYFNRKKI